MNDPTLELPPLPRTNITLLSDLQSGSEPGFNADQMREYARAAVLAERERLAAKWEYDHGFDKYGVAAAIRGQGLK